MMQSCRLISGKFAVCKLVQGLLDKVLLFIHDVVEYQWLQMHLRV